MLLFMVSLFIASQWVPCFSSRRFLFASGVDVSPLR